MTTAGFIGIGVRKNVLEKGEAPFLKVTLSDETVLASAIWSTVRVIFRGYFPFLKHVLGNRSI